MKRILVIILMLPCAAFAAVQYDMVKGIDLTAYSVATAANLNQLVDNGTIANPKGLLYRSLTRPDVTTYPRYTNFVWQDLNYVPPVLKVYVPTGDSDTNWVSATVPSLGVEAANIANGAVTQPKLATNAVDTINILDAAVNSDKLASSSVIAGKIANGAITNGALGTRAVTWDKIEYNSVIDTNIAGLQIKSRHLGPSAVVFDKISDGAVCSNKVADFGIDYNKIATNAINTDALTNGAVTMVKLAPAITNVLAIQAWGHITHPTTIACGYNILRITNSATGQYDVVFTTPMPDTKYAVQITAYDATAGHYIISTLRDKTANYFTMVFYDAGIAAALSNPSGFAVQVSR